MAEQPTKRFRIGYALAQKKQESFIQPSLVNLASERGIDLVRIDTEKPLADQGPFDCVLHKISGEDWKNQLKEYAAANPNTLVIDSPDAIERLHNRISMLDVVGELDFETVTESFGIPKQVVIYDSDTLMNPDFVDRGGAEVSCDCEAVGGRRECQVAQDVFSVQSRGFEQAETADCVARIREPRWGDIQSLRCWGLCEMREEEVFVRRAGGETDEFGVFFVVFAGFRIYLPMISIMSRIWKRQRCLH